MWDRPRRTVRYRVDSWLEVGTPAVGVSDDEQFCSGLPECVSDRAGLYPLAAAEPFHDRPHVTGTYPVPRGDAVTV